MVSAGKELLGQKGNRVTGLDAFAGLGMAAGGSPSKDFDGADAVKYEEGAMAKARRNYRSWRSVWPEPQSRRYHNAGFSFVA